jgi:hypothetical protein
MQVRLRLTIPQALARRWSRPRYPKFHPALRIAVLAPDLSPPQMARRTRKCRVVAASVPVLRRLAEEIETGAIALPLQAAVIAFTGVRHEELTELERDRFWRVFQAPVFEHLLSPHGRIVAMECDAHDGLHLLDQNAPLNGLRARLDRTPCGCGNWHPRLRQIERLDRPSGPTPLIRTPVASHVDEDGHDENQQINTTGRVA